MAERLCPACHAGSYSEERGGCDQPNCEAWDRTSAPTNTLAVGTFCPAPDCQTRLIDDRGEIHDCPLGPHSEVSA